MAQPDWLRLQKIVFARYVQQKLRESDDFKTYEVKNVVEELKDGTLLVNLLSVMSGKVKAKPLKKETMRIKMITSANEALDFVQKDCGVDLKVCRVSAEDIVDGNEQAVMAMLFQIIIAFLKFDDDDDKSSIDVREGLALWLNNKIDGKGIEPVKISNKKIPTKVFHDGMIFNALVHKMRPKLVNWEAMNPANGEKNLEQALELGAKYLNIEKYVTAADILKMDELSIIVYLSDWFNGVILLQKQDVAARRVGKLVDLTILHDKLRAEYTAQGTAVSKWVAAKTAELNKREFDDTLSGIKRLLDQFYAYKATEKGTQIGLKLDATGVFNNLQARLKNHKRPVWKPPAGTSPSELDAKFAELGEVEIKRSVDLNNELARQIKLHRMYKRFQANAAKLTTWAAEKKGYVSARETINSVDAGEDALESLDVYEKEQNHVTSSQTADLLKLLDELVRERFEFAKDATASANGIKSTFAALQSSCAEKRAYLEKALKEQKDLNNRLCKAFADAATSFASWLSNKRSALAAGQDGDLQSQLASCKAQQNDTTEAKDKLADIATKDQAVQARQIGLNPYTNLAAGDLTSEWSQYQLLLAKKIALLEEQIEEAARGGITVEQAAEIDANFNYFDKDKNGFLTTKELKVCLQSLGEDSRPQDVAACMEKYDVDKSNTIKKSEFVEFMKANLGDSGTEPEMITAFKYLCYAKPHILEVELNNVVNDKSFKDHHVAYLKTECGAKGEGYDYTKWTAAAFAR